MPTHYNSKKIPEKKEKGKGKKPMLKDTHEMPDGTIMSGSKHTKDSKPVKKDKKDDMQEITIDGEKIQFKEGALHKQLKTPKDYTFKKAELEKMKKVPTGEMFEFMSKERKMTPLLKKRINFALVLMKGSKK